MKSQETYEKLLALVEDREAPWDEKFRKEVIGLREVLIQELIDEVGVEGIRAVVKKNKRQGVYCPIKEETIIKRLGFAKRFGLCLEGRHTQVSTGLERGIKRRIDELVSSKAIPNVQYNHSGYSSRAGDYVFVSDEAIASIKERKKAERDADRRVSRILKGVGAKKKRDSHYSNRYTFGKCLFGVWVRAGLKTVSCTVWTEKIDGKAVEVRLENLADYLEFKTASLIEEEKFVE